MLAKGRDAFLELKFTLVEIVDLWAARSSWPVDCTPQWAPKPAGFAKQASHDNNEQLPEGYC